MSQPQYIINQIINPPSAGFAYTLIPHDWLSVVVHTPGPDAIQPNEILLDGDVYLKGRNNGLNDRLSLKYDGSFNRYDSSKIAYSDSYLPITFGEFDVLGQWANGKFNITDYLDDYNAGIYVEVVQGVLDSNVKIKRTRPGYGVINVGPITSGATGTFHLEITGAPITSSISFTDTDNLIYLVKNSIIGPFSDTWSTNYTNQIYVAVPPTLDPAPFNGANIDIIVEDGSAPNMENDAFVIYPYVFNNAIWDYYGSGEFLLEWDNMNNRATNYNMRFPFNNPNSPDNDFSGDGGSDYMNSNVALGGCNIKGYSFINAYGAYAQVSCSLDNQVILDISGVTGGSEIKGTFTGRPGNWDVIYLNQGFSGTIDLAAGRSTLVNIFYVQEGYYIDADISQYLHWTGEIHVRGGDGISIRDIRNYQYLPDYFKIVIEPGQVQEFCQSNWGSTYFSGTPVTDVFTIGSYGSGGEISFWREKGPAGTYTGNLLAYNIVLDYYYD